MDPPTPIPFAGTDQTLQRPKDEGNGILSISQIGKQSLREGK